MNKTIDLLKRLYKLGEDGLTLDPNIARETEEMIELLEAEPEATELTAEIRKELEDSECEGKKQVLELCDSIDTLTAENKRLQSELNVIKEECTCEECEQNFNDKDSGITAICILCWNKMVGKLRADIEVQAAEKRVLSAANSKIVEESKSWRRLAEKLQARIEELEKAVIE